MIEKKRKDYAFCRQFNEKPSIIPGCPGACCYSSHQGGKLAWLLLSPKQAAGLCCRALLTKARIVSLMLTKLRNVGLMQNGRATPGTISSGPRRSSRPNGGKPASGLGSKKRKHSASTSPGNSKSQDAPDSNTSGGAHLAPCFQQVPRVCC